MIKSEEYRLKIKELKGILSETGHSLDVDKLRAELKEKTKLSEQPEVYTDLAKSQLISKEIASISNKLEKFDKAEKFINDTSDIIDLLEEENDESLFLEVEKGLKDVEGVVEEMRLQALLRGKYDKLNAIMTLHAGAGGTEACDWTEMLYRMYICYCEKFGYSITELDRLEGDEAGIKSVSFKVEGENAYGYLKAEKGVHRLVRISPFDANKRRHTSFSSLEVMPEIIDDEEIKVNSEDIRVDTFRASGAGGQHINKTDSAIRITHIPTGIVVACQNERSQTQNREMAMRMLVSKLLEKREAERMERDQDIKGEIKKIEWGSQIRSYVFCPYTLVKDHRTGFETGDVDSVMNGNIQGFINDYLKKSQ
ncbi:MAG: peptide chain release factor 2 [Clostridiales bacterium]|nr:peptide chain release factor 2 [Clostridiales bacterium]